MPITADDIEYVTDLFEPLGAITTRKMFGGLMIYADKLVFGLIDSEGTLFLKAVDDFGERLEAAGGTLFTYEGKNGKTGHMNYRTMPEAALDDPALAVSWAQGALDAAHP